MGPIEALTKKEKSDWGTTCKVCDTDWESMKDMHVHFFAAHLTKEVVANREGIYWCPVGRGDKGGCECRFRTLSGLMQHVENGSCARRVCRCCSDLLSIGVCEVV